VNIFDRTRLERAIANRNARDLCNIIHGMSDPERDYDAIAEVVSRVSGNEYFREWGRSFEIDDPWDGCVTVRDYAGLAECDFTGSW